MLCLRSSPHYCARLSLIFETKSPEWVNSLGTTEFAFINEIYTKQLKELEEKNKPEGKEVYKVNRD